MNAVLIAIGFCVTTAAILFLVFDRYVGHRNKDNNSDEPLDLGILYIYEGESRDRYSFAFDCELSEIANYDRVTLKVQRRRERSVEEIENYAFAEDSGPIMD